MTQGTVPEWRRREGMDWAARSRRQRKMRENYETINCGTPTTLGVKGRLMKKKLNFASLEVKY